MGSYTSRIPAIALGLDVKMESVVEETAERIAENARGRVPVRSGALRDAIHIERTGVGEVAVVAGNGKAWYGHIVEHGGAHSPAQPFLAPAVEDVRGSISSIGLEALKLL